MRLIQVRQTNAHILRHRLDLFLFFYFLISFRCLSEQRNEVSDMIFPAHLINTMLKC